MNNILFIGDLHLDSQTPLSRLDNYRELTITKLESLLELAELHGVNSVVCTGDFFEKYDVPISYLNELATVFNKYKSAGVTVYTVIGNHETPYNRMEYFKNTPLSLLTKSGLVKLLNSNSITILKNNIYLLGLNFTDQMDSFKEMKRSSSSSYNIAVIHYAIENTVAGESADKKHFPAFDLVIPGHDHMPYEPLVYNNTTFLRPGSFIRRTKDGYNLTRDITVYKLDTVTKEITKLSLPGVKPANIVFKSEVMNASDNTTANKDFEALFKGEFFKSEEQNLTKIVDGLGVLVTEKTKKTLKDYIKNS